MNSIFNNAAPEPSSSYLTEDQPARKRWPKPALIASACFVFVAVGGYAAFSPFLTVWGMRNAAIAKDGKKFASYIDFPVYKENAKAELNALMMENMVKNKSTSDNAFAGLGMMLAPAMVNNLVDSLVTPAGVERLISGQLTLPATVSAAQSQGVDLFKSEAVNLGYESLNVFRVDIQNPEDKKFTSLFFERRWLGDWKLVGMRLPR